MFQIFIPYTWHEICQNTGFLWSVFSRTRAESTTYDNKVRIILQDQKQLAWKIRCSPLSEMRQITSSFMLVLIISTPTKQPKVLQIPWPTLQRSWKWPTCISNIILIMYNTNLNEKGCLVNSIIAEMCKEKNIYILLIIPEKLSRIVLTEVKFI